MRDHVFLDFPTYVLLGNYPNLFLATQHQGVKWDVGAASGAVEGIGGKGECGGLNGLEGVMLQIVGEPPTICKGGVQIVGQSPTICTIKASEGVQGIHPSQMEGAKSYSQ